MVNGQAGYDTVHFLDTAETGVTTLAFDTPTFDDIFPPQLSQLEWHNLVDFFTAAFGDDPTEAGYSTVIVHRHRRVPAFNTSAASTEHWGVAGR